MFQRTITIDGAEVEKGDILTSNGRVHILNKVLMPNVPRNAAQFLSEKLEFESKDCSFIIVIYTVLNLLNFAMLIKYLLFCDQVSGTW